MVDIVATQTFGSAWDSAVRTWGGRTFLVFLDDEGRRTEYTYRQFDNLVYGAVARFQNLGVKPRTVVAMQICNSPEFLYCLLALVKLGAVAVPISTAVTAHEVGRLYDVCAPEWAVVEPHLLGLHTGLREAGRLPGGILTVRGSGPGGLEGPVDPSTSTQDSFDDSAATRDVTSRDTRTVPVSQPISSDDVAELLFTSGTTAAPKGVMVTQANLVYSGHYAIWQASLREDDRIFTTMPSCHSNFQLVALTGAIMSGAALVLAQRYSARRFWADVRAEHATVLQLTAMLVRTLLLQPPHPDDAHNNVRTTLYFMPLSDDDKQAFEERFAVRFLNSYGLTESICWSVTDPPQGERPWPSVGRAGLGYDVAIMDETGHPLPPNEVGEFWIHGVPGRTLMAGYLNDAPATAASLTSDGWLRTSDMGYMDNDGWFYFVDRSRNLIKRAGMNISASEIEMVLEAIPGVHEAAVIGVPDPIRDQAVKAFILPDPGVILGEEEVRTFCRERLADFKVPEFVEFVTEFPRTESSKIAKKALQNQISEPSP